MWWTSPRLMLKYWPHPPLGRQMARPGCARRLTVLPTGLRGLLLLSLRRLARIAFRHCLCMVWRITPTVRVPLLVRGVSGLLATVVGKARSIRSLSRTMMGSSSGSRRPRQALMTARRLSSMALSMAANSLLHHGRSGSCLVFRRALAWTSMGLSSGFLLFIASRKVHKNKLSGVQRGPHHRRSSVAHAAV